MISAGLYLDLAARINEGHQARIGDTAVTVVPVIVDDLEQADAIARCLTALIGGTVLNAASLSAPESRQGHGNPQVTLAVQTALVLKYPRGERKVIVEIPEPGAYAVTYPSSSAYSGGEQAMLGLAEAVLDARLLAGEIAVVLYDESGMDKYMLQGCWSLLVDQLARLNLGPLRTLVAFVGAHPSIDPHGQPNRGCAFAISDGRLQRRKPHDNAASDAANFATSAARARVLFLGAGFSHSSRLPLGNDLRDSAMRRLLGEVSSGPPDRGGTELAIRFRRWLVGNEELRGSMQDLTEHEFARQLTLEQVLAFEKTRYPDLPTLQEFAQGHERSLRAPGESVVALARLLRIPNHLVLVTVNFDELIERNAPRLVEPFATDDEFTGAADYVTRYLAGSEKKVPLLKLHGTISAPDSCIVTTTQTEQGISADRRKALVLLQGQDAEQTPWIYVGASMRDHDLRSLLTDPSFGSTVDEHWVAPFLDPNVGTFALSSRSACWPHHRTLQSRLITEVADHFMKLLEQRWPTA